MNMILPTQTYLPLLECVILQIVGQNSVRTFSVVMHLVDFSPWNILSTFVLLFLL